MVYLDYNASTPLDVRVAEVVDGTNTQVFGNPSSLHHRSGQLAAEIVEEARYRVGSLVNAPARHVVLTSGASEAATLAIVGAALGSAPDRRNIVVAATEHQAILAASELAAKLAGGQVRTAMCLQSGEVDLDHLDTLVDDSVVVVAVMLANNETGTVGPVTEAGRIAHNAGALYFCDVTQGVAKAVVDQAEIGADLMVFSSHKIYGPKGAGALIAERHTQRALTPIFPGGGQENGLRGGTQNTAAVAGFGLASELAAKEVGTDVERIRELSDRFRTAVEAGLEPGLVQLMGSESHRVSNTMNLRFVGADADAVMASMPDIEVSTGSACHSAVSTPSHVLLSLGLTMQQASECIRFSLGRPTTIEEIDYAAARVVEAVHRVRQMTID